MTAAVCGSLNKMCNATTVPPDTDNAGLPQFYDGLTCQVTIGGYGSLTPGIACQGTHGGGGGMVASLVATTKRVKCPGKPQQQQQQQQF
jgi:hypothetical protein